MIQVGKAINGISINGNEWLLDDENNVMEFNSKDEAKDFLRENGVDIDIEEVEESFTFFDTDKQERI